MRTYRVHAILFVVLLIAFNKFSLAVLLDSFDLEFRLNGYREALLEAAAWLWDGWCVGMIGFIMWQHKPLGPLLRDSAVAWGFSGLMGTLIMITLNPLLVGHLQWLWVAPPLGILLLFAKAFHLGFVRPSTAVAWRLRLRPWATALFGLLTAALLAEAVLTQVAKSQLNDGALASKIWFSRHWEVNEWGYREADGPATGRRNLLLIGDSFLAGHGIKDTRDRFSDHLQAALQDKWQVHNHGENGAATDDEALQMLREHISTDLVVLCWFVNDIENIARRHDLGTGNRPSRPFPISLVHGSYLVNYLYWLLPDAQAGDNYLQFLQTAYSHPAAMEQYGRELAYIQHLAEKEGHAKFAVVLFPMINLVAGSEFALKPMREFWANKGVPCLDLAPVFQPYTPGELVVNASDTHPNEFAHELAGKAILSFLRQHQLID